MNQSVRILLIRTQRRTTTSTNAPSAKVSGTFIAFILSSGTTASQDCVRSASFLSSRKKRPNEASWSTAGAIVCSQYICASKQLVERNGSMRLFAERPSSRSTSSSSASSARAVVVPIEEEKNTNIRNARNANERSAVISSSNSRRLSRRSHRTRRSKSSEWKVEKTNEMQQNATQYIALLLTTTTTCRRTKRTKSRNQTSSLS